MIENINADMNILKCPNCSAPLTLKRNHSNVAYCEYCNKEFVFRQSTDGSISYTDKKKFESKLSNYTSAAVRNNGSIVSRACDMQGYKYDKSKKKHLLTSVTIISLVLVALIAIIMMTGKSGENDDNDAGKSDAHGKYIDKITTYTFDWPDNTLGKTVPKPDFEHGRMYSDSSDKIAVDIGNVSKVEFEDYVKQCTNAGFDVNGENSGTYLHAFNEEGYELQVSYDSKDESMSIIACAPKKIEEYEWPEVGLASLLPVPKSPYGVVRASDDRIEAEIYQTSDKDFEEYADACIKAGFDNHYEKSVNMGYFKGYDDNGYELYISYEENDYNKTMTIILR